MAAFRPLRAPLVTAPVLVLAILALTALYFIGVRLLFGLGAVTNLSAGYPWGIWVVVDIVIGTALGCGGFAIALLVYIFNRRVYHPLVRTALLGGLFGYTLAGVAVMVDLGRYWNFYNLLLPWYAQPNSVMFEVALCVMAYVTVLWIEFAPAFLERLGLERLRQRLQDVMFLFVALGVLLPTMHQSSLGTVLLALGPKLHPLWFTPWLPLLFLISALAMGYAVVIFETTLVSNTYHLASEHRLLARMSGVVAFVLALYLLLRGFDLWQRGALALALDGSFLAASFLVETALLLLAFVILALPSLRASQRLAFLAAIALLAGGSLFRLNAYLIGYRPGDGWVYFPSASELLVTIGIVALEILLYLVFIKKLPVLAQDAHRPAAGRVS